MSSTGRHLKYGGLYCFCPRVKPFIDFYNHSGPYNALKVDVWSLGATIWELAETEPPFSDITDPRQLGTELPSLSQPEIYSRSLHDFLDSCSKPSSSRPDPHDLLTVSPSCYPFPRAMRRLLISSLFRHPLSATLVGAKRLSTCLLSAERLRNACPGDKAPIRQGRCRGHSISYLLDTPLLVNYPPLSCTDSFVVLSVVQYALLWHALLLSMLDSSLIGLQFYQVRVFEPGLDAHGLLPFSSET